MGTAGYMSPEQVRGEKLDARTDIFSFGLVLYEMATGQRAFTGETAAVVHHAILHNSPPPLREQNRTLPAKLVTTIDKALQKDREGRYQSAGEMRADLELLQSGKRSPVRITWQWLAAGMLLIVIALGVLNWRSRKSFRLTANDTIVLADFSNATTDPVFDDALNAALRVELEQTPFLNVLAHDKVRGTLKQMNRPEDARLTPELARDVCLRTNSKAVITGSVADLGNHYRIGLKAVDCETGQVVVGTDGRARNRQQVVKMLGVAGAALRRNLGEPEAVLQRFNQPLDETTSTSLEALQAYSEGRIRFEQDSSRLSAVPYFKRAVDLDPNFAIVYAFLGVIYEARNELVLAIQNESKAFELRERLDQRSRWFTESLYYQIGSGEQDKGNEVNRKWIGTFPTDFQPRVMLAVSLSWMGQYDRALTEYREALRLEPKSPNYSNLMSNYIGMNRLDEAKAVFAEAQTRKLDDYQLRVCRYQVASLEGDEAEMQELLQWAKNTPEAKEWAIQQQGDTASHHGRFRAARKFYSKMQDYNPESADRLADDALLELETGNRRSAREMALKALGTNPSLAVKVTLALVFARTGEHKQSETLMGEIGSLYPVSTMIQEYALPTIRAAIELDKDEAANAIQTLKAAAPYELGSTRSFSCLYPVYVRGLAYLKQGQGSEAAAEFQKMLNHPGIVQDCVTSPLSHLQLARAQAMMGDKDAAGKSYQEFLTLWKDADPDIPIYKQAKAEYAKLR
jgi:tetratricopeptide (TPR) repeat protein